jgi:hypothetical protein
MIDSHYFTALPSGSNATVLLLQFRKLLIKNLLGYLHAIQSSLGLDIRFLIEKYEAIDTKKKFSPAVYPLFSKLVEYSSNGNHNLIIDTLHGLSILPESDIYDSGFKCTSILTESWETDFVNKIRSEHIPSENSDVTIIRPIINPGLSELQKSMFDITNQIKSVDFEFYQEINSYVTRLKLFNGVGLSASTSASVFGAIYLRTPDKSENVETYFAEHIVHETSHLNLEVLHAFDKIVLNEETEKFKSPIRIDPRPMLGIFHATFVLSRMVRLFKRLSQQSKEKDYPQKFNLFRKQFEEGLNTVEKNAVLTDNGKLILNSLLQTAEI